MNPGFSPGVGLPLKPHSPVRLCVPCGEMVSAAAINEPSSRMGTTTPASTTEESIAAKARTTVEERPFKGRVRASNESGL